jgi:XTP/dITP diphosphohydrolase
VDAKRTAHVLVATSNPHKLEEIRAVLTPLGVGVRSLADAGADDLPEPVEDADTFEGNARIKARFYAAATGAPCLADDSGLEVDALKGAPGVRSARYAGSGETRVQRDDANNRKLLTALKAVPDDQRAARFVCAMCLAAPDGSVLAESRGVFAGRIAHAPQGSNGFGYDPLLVLEDGRTSAELTPEEKNARSHRAQAVHAIAPKLAALLTP